MRISLNTVSTTLALATSVSFVSAAATPSSAVAKFVNSAYYVNWAIYGRAYEAKQVPAGELTHLLYAFANVSADGTVSLTDTWSDIERRQPNDTALETGKNVYGNVKELFLLKKKNRQLKTLLSIGGATLSTHFAAAAGSAATRAKFANSSVQLVQDLGFDGLDVDWEYPANRKEGADYVLLLAATRAALDKYAAASAKGYHFVLTAATPAGPQNYGNMDLGGMSAHLDAFNLLSFDYAGPWLNNTGHASNLYADKKNPLATAASTNQAVSDYIKAGVPKRKIVVGLPIYGRAFQNTTGVVGGPYSGVGGGSFENGVWDYKALPKAGAKEYYDATVGASYSYDKATKEFITYDTPKSARAKSKYIKEKGLGGAFFWETSADKVGADSLISTVKEGLKRLEESKNQLSYPASVYDNLKAGFP